MTGAEFFGEPWPSGICDDSTRAPTPVGVPCGLCQVPIAADDRGSFTTFVGADGPSMRPIHRECGFRSVVGGIAHIRRSASCPCQGGTDPDDGLSYRDSALLVWQTLVGVRGTVLCGAPPESERIDWSIKCPICFVHGGAHDLDTHRRVKA